MLSLALPFTAGAGYYVMGWDPAQNASVRDLLRAAALVGPLAALGGALARWWFGGARFGDWLRLALLFWSLQALFFTSFLTNAPRGLVSGVVGSLGYWLGQHETARGGQPWFYYLLLGALYEVLPLALGTCGLVAVCWRSRVATGNRPRPLLHDLPRGGRQRAGSGMRGRARKCLAPDDPVLPLCLLGGWWLASCCGGSDGPARDGRKRSWWRPARRPWWVVAGWSRSSRSRARPGGGVQLRAGSPSSRPQPRWFS
jgi:hypothetical protein